MSVIHTFLGVLMKFRKSDCQLRHVSLLVRMEQLGSQWTGFHNI